MSLGVLAALLAGWLAVHFVVPLAECYVVLMLLAGTGIASLIALYFPSIVHRISGTVSMRLLTLALCRQCNRPVRRAAAAVLCFAALFVMGVAALLLHSQVESGLQARVDAATSRQQQLQNLRTETLVFLNVSVTTADGSRLLLREATGVFAVGQVSAIVSAETAAERALAAALTGVAGRNPTQGSACLALAHARANTVTDGSSSDQPELLLSSESISTGTQSFGCCAPFTAVLVKRTTARQLHAELSAGDVAWSSAAIRDSATLPSSQVAAAATALAAAGLPDLTRVKVRDLTREQKERLSIALQLSHGADRPAAVFVDAPTAGLPESEAAAVLRAMDFTAKQGGIAVVALVGATGSNTSSAALAASNGSAADLLSHGTVDNLLLLAAGGRTIYAGPRVQALRYFRARGWTFEPASYVSRRSSKSAFGGGTAAASSGSARDSLFDSSAVASRSNHTDAVRVGVAPNDAATESFGSVRSETELLQPKASDTTIKPSPPALHPAGAARLPAKDAAALLLHVTAGEVAPQQLATPSSGGRWSEANNSVTAAWAAACASTLSSRGAGAEPHDSNEGCSHSFTAGDWQRQRDRAAATMAAMWSAECDAALAAASSGGLAALDAMQLATAAAADSDSEVQQLSTLAPAELPAGAFCTQFARTAASIGLPALNSAAATVSADVASSMMDLAAVQGRRGSLSVLAALNTIFKPKAFLLQLPMLMWRSVALLGWMWPLTFAAALGGIGGAVWFVGTPPGSRGAAFLASHFGVIIVLTAAVASGAACLQLWGSENIDGALQRDVEAGMSLIALATSKMVAGAVLGLPVQGAYLAGMAAVYWLLLHFERNRKADKLAREADSLRAQRVADAFDSVGYMRMPVLLRRPGAFIQFACLLLALHTLVHGLCLCIDINRFDARSVITLLTFVINVILPYSSLPTSRLATVSPMWHIMRAQLVIARQCTVTNPARREAPAAGHHDPAPAAAARQAQAAAPAGARARTRAPAPPPAPAAAAAAAAAAGQPVIVDESYVEACPPELWPAGSAQAREFEAEARRAAEADAREEAELAASLPLGPLCSSSTAYAAAMMRVATSAHVAALLMVVVSEVVGQSAPHIPRIVFWLSVGQGFITASLGVYVPRDTPDLEAVLAPPQDQPAIQPQPVGQAAEWKDVVDAGHAAVTALLQRAVSALGPRGQAAWLAVPRVAGALWARLCTIAARSAVAVRTAAADAAQALHRVKIAGGIDAATLLRLLLPTVQLLACLHSYFERSHYAALVDAATMTCAALCSHAPWAPFLEANADAVAAAGVARRWAFRTATITTSALQVVALPWLVQHCEHTASLSTATAAHTLTFFAASLLVTARMLHYGSAALASIIIIVAEPLGVDLRTAIPSPMQWGASVARYTSLATLVFIVAVQLLADFPWVAVLNGRSYVPPLAVCVGVPWLLAAYWVYTKASSSSEQLRAAVSVAR